MGKSTKETIEVGIPHKSEEWKNLKLVGGLREMEEDN